MAVVVHVLKVFPSTHRHLGSLSTDMTSNAEEAVAQNPACLLGDEAMQIRRVTFHTNCDCNRWAEIKSNVAVKNLNSQSHFSEQINRVMAAKYITLTASKHPGLQCFWTHSNKYLFFSGTQVTTLHKRCLGSLLYKPLCGGQTLLTSQKLEKLHAGQFSSGPMRHLAKKLGLSTANLDSLEHQMRSIGESVRNLKKSEWRNLVPISLASLLMLYLIRRNSRQKCATAMDADKDSIMLKIHQEEMNNPSKHLLMATGNSVAQEREGGDATPEKNHHSTNICKVMYKPTESAAEHRDAKFPYCTTPHRKDSQALNKATPTMKERSESQFPCRRSPAEKFKKECEDNSSQKADSTPCSRFPCRDVVNCEAEEIKEDSQRPCRDVRKCEETAPEENSQRPCRDVQKCEETVPEKDSQRPCLKSSPCCDERKSEETASNKMPCLKSSPCKDVNNEIEVTSLQNDNQNPCSQPTPSSNILNSGDAENEVKYETQPCKEVVNENVEPSIKQSSESNNDKEVCKPTILPCRDSKRKDDSKVANKAKRLIRLSSPEKPSKDKYSIALLENAQVVSQDLKTAEACLTKEQKQDSENDGGYPIKKRSQLNIVHTAGGNAQTAVNDISLLTMCQSNQQNANAGPTTLLENTGPAVNFLTALNMHQNNDEEIKNSTDPSEVSENADLTANKLASLSTSQNNDDNNAISSGPTAITENADNAVNLNISQNNCDENNGVTARESEPKIRQCEVSAEDIDMDMSTVDKSENPSDKSLSPCTTNPLCYTKKKEADSPKSPSILCLNTVSKEKFCAPDNTKYTRREVIEVSDKACDEIKGEAVL
ncbi:mediator of RNA polymerase II transcription subunit 26 [Biomphalaria glabrata]|nr:mediator of RNA polymerase II transcription subunit 26 [Biomphalaria glabrata]